MFTFIKAQAASLTATASDFLMTILLVEVFGCWYVAASATGTLTGGICNFIICRRWVFNAENGPVRWQAMKYVLVWIGNLGLNAGGVFLVTHYVGWSYLISKIFISLAVGAGYNYVLQKKFVFK